MKARKRRERGKLHNLVGKPATQGGFPWRCPPTLKAAGEMLFFFFFFLFFSYLFLTGLMFPPVPYPIRRQRTEKRKGEDCGMCDKTLPQLLPTLLTPRIGFGNLRRSGC